MSMTHSEIGHAWYYGEKSRGSASHVFYEGNTIYSYGYHFPIAHKLHGDRAIILFNSDGYSSSTGGHKNSVRAAIDVHASRIFSLRLDTDIIRALEGSKLGERALTRAYNEFQGGIERRMRAYVSAKPRYRPYRARELEETLGAAKDFDDLCVNVCHLKLGKRRARKLFLQTMEAAGAVFEDEGAFEKLREAMDKLAAREKHAAVALVKKREKENAAQLAQWHAGEDVPCPRIGNLYHLRVHDGYVESSGGVRLPVSTLKALAPYAARALRGDLKTQEFKSYVGDSIGRYPIHQVAPLGGEWILGCHHIAAKEVLAVVNVLCAEV